MHRWTYREEELCCKEYFKTYVEERIPLPLSDFVRRLALTLPDIPESSLRMKVQNIKQLSIEAGIADSLQSKPLSNCSQQNRRAFFATYSTYGLFA